LIVAVAGVTSTRLTVGAWTTIVAVPVRPSLDAVMVAVPGDIAATIPVAIAAATFAVFAYVMGRVDTSTYLNIFYLRNAGELTIFCSAIFGACVGFLWYNSHPADVFMGDTGSLALGGALGAVAILLKSEFLLLIVGGVFVAETASVILQRSVFKYRKRRHGEEYAKANRVFRRAPLHHHFELKGWYEVQVVTRFWILGILCAFFALTTLKLR
jgi:phospho-N-acetylmuramoyl-pentapeptide-transferase